MDHLVNGLSKALPGSAAGVFNEAVKSAQNHKSGSLATVIVGIVVAVWSASGGMAALETALDVAYEVPTNAKFLKKRGKALLLMLCTVVFGGIASILIVEGAPLGKEIGSLISSHGTGFNIVWDVVRWALTIILVSLLFSCYDDFGPNRETPKWQWVSRAASLARSSSWPPRWGCPSTWRSWGTPPTPRPTARWPVLRRSCSGSI